MSNRFVILADAHLGLVGLQPDGKTYGDVAPVFERAVARARHLDPSHVVLLGDLVNRGHDHEYERVRQTLGPLFERCHPVVGNHELQRASIADFERNMRTRAFRTLELFGLPTIILNTGIEGLPDSEWQGAIDARQLRFVDETLAAIPAGPLLIFIHHPIAGTTRDSAEPMFHIVNSADLQSRLGRHVGPVVVFCAHTHAQSIVHRGRFAYVGAPAVGFWPHAFLVVEVDPRGLRVSTVRVLDRPEDSPDARAADPAYRAAREGTEQDWAATIPLESGEP